MKYVYQKGIVVISLYKCVFLPFKLGIQVDCKNQLCRMPAAVSPRDTKFLGSRDSNLMGYGGNRIFRLLCYCSLRGTALHQPYSPQCKSGNVYSTPFPAVARSLTKITHVHYPTMWHQILRHRAQVCSSRVCFTYK